MIVRRAAVLVAAILLVGLVDIPASAGDEDPTSVAVQEEAANEVQAQLASTDEPLTTAAIDGLDELGPAPWLSLGRARSEAVVEAWLEVAQQLPASEMRSRSERHRKPRFTEIAEREAPGQTGVNDTAATGQRIRRFGTGRGQNRAVTITGHLSGADEQLPVPYDCFSVEDDGAIPLANETPFEVSLCGGRIGDGPNGETTGDIDVFSMGPALAGSLLVMDLINVSESLRPVDAVVAIYNAEGDLLVSAQDDGDPNAPDFALIEAPADGEYFGVVIGAGPLPEDPFDSTSGPGAGETGTYDAFVVNLPPPPPPCLSVEDDGSIPLANDRTDLVGFVDFCEGVIGDGPFGDTSGDADFWAIGTVAEGDLIIADLVNFEGPGVEAEVAVYDGAGNLVASTIDSGDPEAPEFLEVPAPVTGPYVVAVVGCCGLPADPFDSGSGVGVTATGPYGLFLGSVPPPPPPCVSIEDDGAIPLANDASAGFGDDELFVTFCDGFVGDGPQVATGDVDVYTTREIEAGKVLVVDLIDIGPDPVIVDFTVGIYDDGGNLVASGQDSDGGEAVPGFVEFTVPETGVYHVAIAGGLPTDPFDSTTGTDTAIAGVYAVALVDAIPEIIDGITGGANWGYRRVPVDLSSPPTVDPDAGRTAALAAVAERRADIAEAMADAEPVIDVDVYLVRLDKGDAISGGFDAARVTGIIDPDGVVRMESRFNPSFIYPVDSPLRHDRRLGFDHVATRRGLHAVFVAEGDGPYEGELRVAKAGLADERSRAQQIVFVDFDGAAVSPDIFGPPPPVPTPAAELSPLADFLPAWGLDPADEDAVIDAVLDAMVENLDTDLRIRDGRNRDRDRTRRGGDFDIEILNSRDHGDRWGDPDVSRIVIGGTIDELQIPTIGIAQSIDPGNLDTTETGVVLLDLLSLPAGDPISLNTYGLANGATKVDLVGLGVGHIAAHEVGHFVGNWHTETFNAQPSLMDAGGEFSSIFGVGPDGVLGTADDVDADFVTDIFNVFEGFVGEEDTAGRTVFAFSTGSKRGPKVKTGVLGDSVTEENGLGAVGVTVQLFERTKRGGFGHLVDSAVTNYAGFYSFTADAGCYRIRFVAPEGRTFVNGKATTARTACIAGGQTKLRYDAVLASP